MDDAAIAQQALTQAVHAEVGRLVVELCAARIEIARLRAQLGERHPDVDLNGVRG